MIYKLKVLVDDESCARNDCKKVKSWVSDLTDLVEFEYIVRSNPNWDDEFVNADIHYDGDNNFRIPLDPNYAYIYHLPDTGAGVNGLSYVDHNGGFAIVVRGDETDEILRLRFRHEMLHWGGYPADAMSYWYFAKAPTIMDTVMYALFGCKPFSSHEGNPNTRRVIGYQNRYYDMCYSLWRNNVKADWENDDAPGWLKR